MDNEKGAVVVTGASTGIGRASATRLARGGFQVFAGVRKDSDAESIRSEGIEGLEPVMIDVTDESSIGSAREQVENELGGEGLAGLVNNAGISVPAPLEFLPLDDLRRQLEVNLIGQVAVTQAFLPLIREARGRIVNMASIGGRTVAPMNSAYHIAKFGMEAFSDGLRVEVQPWDIHVACIEPGSIATPIWEKGASEGDQTREAMGEEGEALYGGAVDALQKTATDTAERGIPPDEVAKRVEHALTARRPKTRYLVGTDAKIMARARRVLGDRGWDRLVTQQMKLPKRGSAA